VTKFFSYFLLLTVFKLSSLKTRLVFWPACTTVPLLLRGIALAVQAIFTILTHFVVCLCHIRAHCLDSDLTGRPTRTL